jgi:para-aminobenzoate synthetase/4-amino-4-deoxychorismate lyase
MDVIPTPYCHQMVTRVRALLDPAAPLADVLAATFPCGSVTGAPKVAARSVIAALEGGPRGAYTGALLVAGPGALDSSVLIRTLELAPDGSAAYGTGCGIVWDSDPAREWEESVLKAAPVAGESGEATRGRGPAAAPGAASAPAPGLLPPVSLRETCRVVDDRVPLWRLHRARLAAGGVDAPGLAQADAAVHAALRAGGGPRLTLTVHPGGRVHAERSDAPSSIARPGGVRCAFVDLAAAPAAAPGAAKPADRSAWDAAAAQAHAAGADIALVVVGDHVVDGSTATLWVCEGATLVTPPAPPAVAGVARAYLLERAAAEGIEVRIEPVTRARVLAADALFVSNAYGGVALARLVDNADGGVDDPPADPDHPLLSWALSSWERAAEREGR